MCKSKTQKNKSGGVSQKKDVVRTLSFVIIGVCIFLLLGLLGLMVWRATNNNPVIYRVIVTTDNLPDSLKTYNYVSGKEADSLIMAVKAYDDQLTQKYQYLVEQKEQDSQVFYWGSLIVGVIIAVFGWFGFQSFTTVEDKAKRKAIEIAKRTAWSATQVFLKDEGKKQIDEAAKNNLQKDAVQKIKDQVLDELNSIIENRIEQHVPTNRVDDLEKRIDDMQKSIAPDIDKAVNKAVQDFFKKYRKPVKGVTEKEEDKK
jgi:polyhydroxyalkanoate synthesis regulator phasin